mgnify:CR=1 FL=1
MDKMNAIVALALEELKKGNSQFVSHRTSFEKAGVCVYSARSVWLEVNSERYMIDIYRHRLTFGKDRAPFRSRPIGKITVTQHGILSNGTIWIDIDY